MAATGRQIEAGRRASVAHEAASRIDGVAPGDYFSKLLRLIQDALSPRSATAWGVDQHGVLTKIAEVAAAARRVRRDPLAVTRTNRILDALMAKEPRTFLLETPAGSESAAELEVLVPFHDGVRPCGVLEVVVAHSPADAASVDHAVALAREFSGYASHYVKTLTANAERLGPAQFAEQLNHVTLTLHSELCVNHVAMTAVNEGRTLLGFERLSLAVRHRRRIEMAAVSGQESIATRSNLVRAMTDLASVLLEADQAFRFDGDADILPPQIRESVLEYMQESGARCIEAYPLRVPRSDDGQAPAAAQSDPLGILLGEYFQPTPQWVDPAQAEAFAAQVAVALGHSQQWERLTTPLRRLMRRFFGPGEFRSRRLAAAAWAAVAATIVAVGMTPVHYRVETAGRLLPMQRSSLFAPLDGRVSEVFVEGNQSVSQGQPLLRLQNDRLAADIIATRHQLQEQSKLMATLEAQHAMAQDRGQGPDSIRLTGAISQTRIELASLQSKLNSLESESAELEVRAPLAGIVATFEPRQLLLNRPVRRGDTLLEVMNTEGRWELVVDLPAHRVGHVLRAQAAADATAVPVEFTLATQPECVHVGALRTVPSRIVAGADGNAVAQLEVNVAVSEIDHPVAGADVMARIDCGKRALAWVLFGDVVDFFRRRLW